MKMYKYEIFENNIKLKEVIQVEIKNGVLPREYVLLGGGKWYLMKMLGEFKFAYDKKSKVSGKTIPVLNRYFFKRLTDVQKTKVLLDSEKFLKNSTSSYV